MKKHNLILLGSAAVFVLIISFVRFSEGELLEGKLPSLYPSALNPKTFDSSILKVTNPSTSYSIDTIPPVSKIPPLQESPALENVAVTFPGPNGLTLSGRIYKPQGNGPFPAVVFMHGCSGLLTGANNDLSSDFKYWGLKMKNEENVVALFVDSFTPRGISTVCGNGNILNEATERPKDAYAGLTYLRTFPYIKSQKIALVGWSNGASAVLSSVAKNNNPVPLPPQGGFITALAEYPGCGLRSYYGTDYSSVQNISKGTYLPYVRTVILAGENDTTTPPNPKCTNLVTRAQQLGASSATSNEITLTIYPGAQHGFDRAEAGNLNWTQADVTARDLSRSTVVNHLRSFFN